MQSVSANTILSNILVLSDLNTFCPQLVLSPTGTHLPLTNIPTTPQ